jgi:hypothetical protein
VAKKIIFNTSKLPRRGDEDMRSGGERRNLLSGKRWPSSGVFLESVPEVQFVVWNNKEAAELSDRWKRSLSSVVGTLFPACCSAGVISGSFDSATLLRRPHYWLTIQPAPSTLQIVAPTIAVTCRQFQFDHVRLVFFTFAVVFAYSVAINTHPIIHKFLGNATRGWRRLGPVCRRMNKLPDGL